MRSKMAELHKLKDYATVYTLKVLLLMPFSTSYIPQEFPQHYINPLHQLSLATLVTA